MAVSLPLPPLSVSLPAEAIRESLPAPPTRELLAPLPVIVSAKPLPITFSNWLTLKVNGSGAAVPLTVTTPVLRLVTVPLAGATLAPLWSTVSPSSKLPMTVSMPIKVSVPRAPLPNPPKARRLTTALREL